MIKNPIPGDISRLLSCFACLLVFSNSSVTIKRKHSYTKHDTANMVTNYDIGIPIPHITMLVSCSIITDTKWTAKSYAQRSPKASLGT